MVVIHDALVVGGGAVALAVARSITIQRLDVAVVAPEDPAVMQGATVAAGAMQGAYGEITVSTQNSPTIDFCIEAQRGFGAWLAAVAEEAGTEIYTTQGTFVVANARCAEDEANLNAIEAKLIANHEPYQRVDPKSLPGLKPHPSAFVQRCLYIDREGSVNSRQLITALRRGLAARSNVTLVDGLVDSVRDATGGHWVVSLRDGRKVAAKKLVIAAGAYSLPLIGHIVQDLVQTYRPFAGHGTALELGDAIGFTQTIRTPNRGTACGFHVVPCGSGRVYIGATNRARLLGQVTEGPPAEDIHALLDSAVHEVNVDLGKLPILRVHSGLRPVCADNMPLIGGVGIPGLFVATATHRTGILMSPEIARLVAQEVVGADPSPSNVFALTAERSARLKARDRSTEIGGIISRALDEYMHPHGYLPYDRQERLTELLKHMAHAALGESANGLDGAALRTMLNAYPDFAVPSLINAALRSR